MLKKFISILVLCTMLTGLFAPAYAADAEKTYEEYLWEDNATITGSSVPLKYSGGKTQGFNPGNSVFGKMGDPVYEFNAVGSGHGVSLNSPTLTKTYENGEKVHISAEIMVPEGTEDFTWRYGGPNISITPYVSPDGQTTGYIGIAMQGAKADHMVRYNRIIEFDYNHRIALFGGSVLTDMNWYNDIWYKIDVVIVMGDNPKAAIYVNGQPLKINTDFGTGISVGGVTSDATFDGVKTSTDYIDIGHQTGDGGTINGFKEGGIYGIKNYSIGASCGDSSDDKSTIYFDNFNYKAMSANDWPVIDSGLGIKGISDGAAVDRAELENVEINVPAWYAHKTAKLALSVDGAEALVDTSAPFTFDLSTLERGVRHLTLTAYDDKGAAIASTTRTLVVAGNEERTFFQCDFNEIQDNYKNSSFFDIIYTNLSYNKPEGKLSFADVTDSAGEKKTAAKLFSKGNLVAIGGGEKEVLEASGTVNVSYDMYLDNTNISTLTFCNPSNGYVMLKYDNGVYTTEKKQWSTGVDPVSFAATVGYWQNWNWTLDYKNKEISLKVDGKTVLNKLTMGSTLASGYKRFTVCFVATSGSESFVAIDNMKITRSTGIPAVEYNMYDYNNHKTWSEYDLDTMYNFGVDIETDVEPTGDNSRIYAGKIMNSEGTAPLNESFGDSIICNFSSSDAYSASECVIPFTYGTGKKKHASGYGDMVAEFDFYVENTNHSKVLFRLDNAILATITNANLVYVGDGDGMSTGFSITPGQWHRFKFMIEYNYGGNFYVRLYVDGNEIFYGKMSYRYKFRNSYRPSTFKWCITPVTDSEDSTKYAANKMAIDNISFSFEPVTPYISSVDFGSENSKEGLVLNTANTATVKVSGIPLDFGYINNNGALVGHWVEWPDGDAKVASVLSKIKLIDLETNSAVDGVVTSAAAENVDTDVINVTLSGLNLEAGKQYKILLDSGVGFDYYYNNANADQLYYTTNEPSSFVFTAVESFDEEATPDDGVAGDITITDVRFTTNGAVMLKDGIVTGYTGGEITQGKQLRADVKVNNASSNAKTFRVAIATYEDGALTGISLGEEYTLLPNAKDMVFTSGKITVSETSAPDIKVMILEDTDTLVPVSKAFSLEN